MFNLARLINELGTREQCVSFAVENNLILAEKKCSKHRIPMRLYSQNQSVGFFLCSKRSCRDRSRVARGNGTWFENVKISLTRVYYLMYCFAHRKSYEFTIHEDPDKSVERGCLSEATVAYWFNRCRETVIIYQLEQQEAVENIGGPGKVVQIDETEFRKRKHTIKGHQFEGHWVLGIIEDGSEDLRLEVCTENAEVLVPLIQKHVAEGTTIYTDYWPAFDCLGQHGYIHKKIDHNDPDNPYVAPDGTCTKRIESQWRVMKSYYKKDNYNCSIFGDTVLEYMWRSSVEKNKKDPFFELIKCIKYVYNKK